MPDNKSQHFVPKAYLRPFTSNADRTVINVLNVARERFIPDAPIKGQCAKSYFYGEDGLLERFLQGIEGRYATNVRNLSADPTTLTSAILMQLRDFALLQYFRTAARIENMLALSVGFNEQLAHIKNAEAIPRFLATQKESMVFCMQVFIHARPLVRDLRTVILLNHTKSDFITSDDPTILTNRFHFQKLRTDAFGLKNSGEMIYMSMTPKMAFLAYDHLVYATDCHGAGLIHIDRPADVSALNELAMLHARNNAYFSDWKKGDEYLKLFRSIQNERPKDWNRFIHFQKIGEDERGEEYVRIDKMMVDEIRSGMIAMQPIHPRPNNWPRFLRYSIKPKFVETNSAGGVMRRKEQPEDWD